MKIASFCLALGISLFTISVGGAHEGATGVVKERMDLMKEMTDILKKMAPIIQGGEIENFAILSQGAARIANNARASLDKYPHGSLSKVSEAKEEIWQNWSEFETLMTDLATEAERLKTLSENKDREKLLGQFETVAQSCKACHKKYRLEK